MILHVLFQVLCFLLGLTLMISALVFDAELERLCPEIFTEASANKLTTVRNCSNIILAIGTLLFSMTTTVIVYSFMMAGTGKSRINNPTYLVLFIYLITIMAISVVVGVCGAIIKSNISWVAVHCSGTTCDNTDSDQNNSECFKNVDKLYEYVKGFWIIGGVGGVLSVILAIVLYIFVKKSTVKWTDHTVGTVQERKDSIEAARKAREKEKIEDARSKEKEAERKNQYKEQIKKLRQRLDDKIRIELVQNEFTGDIDAQTLKDANKLVDEVWNKCDVKSDDPKETLKECTKTFKINQNKWEHLIEKSKKKNEGEKKKQSIEEKRQELITQLFKEGKGEQALKLCMKEDKNSDNNIVKTLCSKVFKDGEGGGK